MASAQEIVDELVSTRERRRGELYRLILHTFLAVVERVYQDPAYDSAIFSDKRTYGRNSELCSVWVVSLHAVLHDTMPNLYQRQGRSSILSLMEPALRHIPFPFTVELFKDAVKSFDYVYGIAVDISEVVFPKCDCIDVAGNPTFHTNCRKPAVVIVKHLYSEEEMYRREADAAEVEDGFARVEEEIEVWLQIKEGKMALQRQLEAYRSHWKENLSINDELLENYQNELKESRSKVGLINEQMDKFMAGKAYAKPLFKTMDEANDLLAIENDKILVLNQKVEKLRALGTELKTFVGMKKSQVKDLAIEQLKRKYCFLEYHDHILDRQRRYALKHQLARPWDGEEGLEYKNWWKFHVHDTTLSGESNQAELEGTMLSRVGRKRVITEKYFGDDVVEYTLEAEYNWDGCEEIGMNFQLNLYDDYKFRQRSKL